MAIDAQVEQVYIRVDGGAPTHYARVMSPVVHSAEKPPSFLEVPIPERLFDYLENRIVHNGRPQVMIKGRVGNISISLERTMREEFDKYQRKVIRSPTETPALVPAGNSMT